MDRYWRWCVDFERSSKYRCLKLQAGSSIGSVETMTCGVVGVSKILNGVYVGVIRGVLLGL